MNCTLLKNCRNRSECIWCKDYSEYAAIDKKIKSPPQMEMLLAKKQAKKEKKLSDPSKRGRANRLAGKRAEKERRAVWESHGYVASPVPMSGALKSSVIVHDTKINMSSDNWVTINDKIYYEEVKRSGSINKLYTLSNYGCVKIEGIGYLFRDDIWWMFLNHIGNDIVTIPNKGFKQLEKWFAQDNADIVSTKSSHLPWITIVRESVYEELR